MAAISSTGSGNWPACLSATPTVVDDVTISAGHLVNIPSGTVGVVKTCTVNHTAGTTGLTIALGGELRIQDATAAVYSQTALAMNPSANSTTPGILVLGKLTNYQGAAIGTASFSAPLEFRGGGFLEGRGHLAAHATMPMIQLGLASQTSAPNGRLNVTSASNANPAVFSRLYFSNNGTNGGGTPQVDGAQFLNCGSSSQQVFTWSLFSAAHTVKLLNCIFDGCGKVVNNANTMAATQIVRYENITVRNSVSAITSASITTGPGNAVTSGTRTLWNIRSDRQININCATLDVSNVVVDIPSAGATSVQPFLFGATASLARFEKIVTRFNSSFGGGGTWTLPYGTTADRVLVLCQNSSNAHPVGVGGTAGAASTTTTLTRFLFQMLTVDTISDGFFVTTNPTNLQTIIVRNCMAMPCATDHTKHSINLVTPKSDPTNTRWTVEHCTVFTSGGIESGLVTFGESWSVNPANASGVVIFPSVRSNLVYGLGSAADRGVIVRYGSAGGVTYSQNNFDPAQTGWNGKFNLSTGTDGVGYIGDNGNSTPSIMNPAGGTAGINVNFGQNDVVADPVFVSGTTFPDLGTYYATVVGTTGSVVGDFDAALAKMMQKNDVTGYDSRFEPDTAIDWILGRYAPTAAALDAAHDAGSPTTAAGATMGAVARFVNPTPTTPTIALSVTDPVNFSGRQGDPSPAARTVAITNSGTGTLSGITATLDAGSAGYMAASLDQTTAPATLTLTPTTGVLGMGDYPYTCTVASTAPNVTNSPQTVTGVFSLDAPLLGAAVLALNGAPTSSTVPLAWTAAPGGATPLAYEVQWGAGVSPTTWTSLVTGLTALAYNADGFGPVTVLSFRVVASDPTGQQTVSNTISTTTAAAATAGVFGVDRARRNLSSS